MKYLKPRFPEWAERNESKKKAEGPAESGVIVQNTLENKELKRLLSVFEQCQKAEDSRAMSVKNRSDIRAFDTNWEAVNFKESQLEISYPPQVTEALIELYREYIHYFWELVTASTENEVQYPIIWQEWATVSNFVQIDMTWIPQWFIDHIENEQTSPQLIREVLRKKIFEIENSLAAYSLLSWIWSAEESEFNTWLQKWIASIEQTTWKPVILLCLSDEKYDSVMRFDLWFSNPDDYNPQEIKERFWFSDIYWPKDVLKALEDNEDVLFYTRSSLSMDELKAPSGAITESLLKNKEVYEYIRSRSVTQNIDNPNSEWQTTNDTKKYMPQMWMWFAIKSIDDILSFEYITYLQWKQKNPFQWRMYNDKFVTYLRSYGYSDEDINSWEIEFHAKPQDLAYGVYGHVAWNISDGKKRKLLQKWFKDRGTYIIQPRLTRSSYTDSDTWTGYIYIDRLFFYYDFERQEIKSMWGFRNHMPVESNDWIKWVVHGWPQTVYAPISLKI